jgi:hypothetical protein
MSTTGYILNGKYVRASEVDTKAKVPRKQILHKQGEIEHDARQFARDLVQPYLPNGQPNPEFIRALPEEAERYGFVKKEDRNA